jgi:hypothetical protein
MFGWVGPPEPSPWPGDRKTPVDSFMERAAKFTMVESTVGNLTYLILIITIRIKL